MRSDEMKELLEARGYEVAEVVTVKNGINKKALQLILESEVRPILYPESCGSESDLDKYINEALKSLSDITNLTSNEKLLHPSTFYKSAELCLESRSNINEATDYITYNTEFYDLVAYIRVFLNDNASLKVTERMLEKWKLDRMVAYNIALDNSRSNSRLISIEELIFGCETEPKDSFMNVLTNDRKSYCGGAILSEAFQDSIKKELRAEHLYILPSSIHELIIIRGDDESIALNKLIEMVHEVNNTTVDPEDRLVDNAYLI